METEREIVSLSYAFWSRHFPPPFYVDYHYKKIRNGWWHIMLTLCSLNVKNILNWATKMQALGNWHQECDSRSPQGGESSLFQSCTVCCSISFFNTSNDGKLKVPWDPNKSMAKCSLKLTVVNLTEIENAVIQSDPLRSTHKHSTHRNACEHSDWYSKHAVSSTESQQLLVAASAW